MLIFKGNAVQEFASINQWRHAYIRRANTVLHTRLMPLFSMYILPGFSALFRGMWLRHTGGSKLLLACMILARIFSTQVHAQDPACWGVSTAQGLPSNTVYDLLQDPEGFIWMAHDKGLSRYDGRSFVHYASPSQQGRSLSNLHWINGRVWCQDFTGNLFYTQGQTLAKLTEVVSHGWYMPSGMLGQALLARSYTHLAVVDGSTARTRKVKLPFSNVLAVTYAGKKALFASGDSIFSFDGLRFSLVHTIPKAQTPFFFLKQVNGVLYGIKKNTYPYVYKIAPGGLQALPLLQPGVFIQNICVVKDELWLLTTAGAYCFDTLWRPRYNGYAFFRHQSIAHIMQDREGNYWFATLNKGITVVPNLQMRVYPYQEESITALAMHKGRLIAGTANHRLLSFSAGEKQFFTSVYQEQSHQEVLGLLASEETGELLFCSDRLAFVKNGRKTRELTNYAAKSIAIINNDFYAVAYSAGVSLVRRQQAYKAAVPPWLQRPGASWHGQHFPLFDTAVRGRSVMYHPGQKTLYAATSTGLYYFSPQGHGQVLYQGRPLYVAQLALAGGAVYAGSYTHGLFCIVNPLQVYQPLPDTQNQPIYQMRARGPELWMVGEGQVSCYHVEQKKYGRFTHASGLPRSEIKDVLATPQQLFLATSGGLAVLERSTIKASTLPPSLVLNGLLVNNVPMAMNAAQTLESSQNNLEIPFSILAFGSADNEAYLQYRINGQGWQNLAASSRQLSLPALAPGEYTVYMRALNEDGLASPILRAGFGIALPWYKRPWFYLLSTATLLALVLALFSYRLRNLQQKNALHAQKILAEQALQKSMLASIKSQMNPHFLFNALNTIQSYIYTNDKENATLYLGRFSELTRLILDMSAREVISLDEEIRALQLYLELEQLRFEDKLQHQFFIDASVSAASAFIPSMLIQPYVENAIKHGLMHKRGPWQLHIHLVRKRQHIVATIDDNGIGRKQSQALNKMKQKHRPFALSANEKRLEILNQGLETQIGLYIEDKVDVHGRPAGTRVCIHIPLQPRPGHS